MPRDLASKVRIYAAMTENLPNYREWMDVTSALVWRDAVYDAIKAGELLSPTVAMALKKADDRLVELRELLMSRFPEVFEERGASAEYWWWHLDEGPQVREQAERAA